MVGFAVPARPRKPSWVEALLKEKFFGPCLRHSVLKKNEKNIYCIDCCIGFCQHCLPSHQSHRVLQIRRYVYHDVIRLLDIQKLLDCSQVQAYIINSAKVVFLNERPHQRPLKAFSNSCESCHRILQDAYNYCSVSCKVDAMVKQGKKLQSILPGCDNLNINININLDLDNGSLFKGICAMEEEDEEEKEQQLSPQSVLAMGSSPTSSSSTGEDHRSSVTINGPDGISYFNYRLHLNKRKKPPPPILRNKRKSTPCRAPFF